MLMNLIFCFTFVISFLNMVSFLAIILGNKCIILFPLLHFVDIKSNNVYILYPAAIHQTYYWFSYYGVLS